MQRSAFQKGTTSARNRVLRVEHSYVPLGTAGNESNCGGRPACRRRAAAGGNAMTSNEERKRTALSILGAALFQIEDELGEAKVHRDQMVIVAALIEQAVAVALDVWEPDKARVVVHEIVDAAF